MAIIIVSIVSRKRGGKKYLYFQAGREDDIYLGPEGEPQKLKPENVLKAIDYLDSKLGHYEDVREQMISFLPKNYKPALMKGPKSQRQPGGSTTELQIQELLSFIRELGYTEQEQKKREVYSSILQFLQNNIKDITVSKPEPDVSPWILDAYNELSISAKRQLIVGPSGVNVNVFLRSTLDFIQKPKTVTETIHDIPDFSSLQSYFGIRTDNDREAYYRKLQERLTSKFYQHGSLPLGVIVGADTFGILVYRARCFFVGDQKFANILTSYFSLLWEESKVYPEILQIRRIMRPVAELQEDLETSTLNKTIQESIVKRVKDFFSHGEPMIVRTR